MELIFLGTSAGTPTTQRNVSGTAIRMARSKSWCLVDCGEGTQHRILQTPLSLYSLDTIFITHVHGDHCFGLPGLLASASLTGRKSALRIYGPPAVETFIRTAIEVSESWLSYELEFIPVTTAIHSLECGDFTVEIIELSHRVPSFAYGFTEKVRRPRLNVAKLLADQVPSGIEWGQLHAGNDVRLENGQRLRSEDYLLAPQRLRKIIICGDNDKPTCLADSAANADLIVHEATYTDAVAIGLKFDPGHSTASAIAGFAEAASVRNLILTHFSSRYQLGNSGTCRMTEIEEEARAHYSGYLHLAQDLDRFRLDDQGKLVLIKPE